MSAPLVSVCIPARDHATFIREALASVLSQPVDLEVVVHDDASDDGTAEVVRSVADPRIAYRRHPRPVGVAANRTGCLKAARGRFVAWLDADDAYRPDMLARQVEALERHPGAALVHGRPRIVDAAGRRLPEWRQPFTQDTVEPSATAFRELILANEVTTSTVVVRAEAHRAAGPFVASGPTSSDWDMWLRLAARGDVAYTATHVTDYRQHAETISHAATLTGARLQCDERVVERVLRLEAIHLPDRWRVRRRARCALAAKALLHAGERQARGEQRAATEAVELAERLAPPSLGDHLAALRAATAGAYAWHRISKAVLRRLAEELEGTRFGAAIRRAATTDPAWEQALERIAGVLRRVTPDDAVVGSVTKWDPTLLHLSGRRGRQFPDRALMPDGYPPDSASAVAHLEVLRREGLSHLVLPSASFWWLEHYSGLARHLRTIGTPVHEDDDCVIFVLATR
jgi:glycosyl transferase family 2